MSHDIPTERGPLKKLQRSKMEYLFTGQNFAQSGMKLVRGPYLK